MVEEPVKSVEIPTHHVFGRLIADFGYKRMYASSISQLITADVWNRQRILRSDRAKKIADAVNRSGKSSALAGAIALYEDQSTGACGIIDGQHRVAALALLAADNKWSHTELNISVEVCSLFFSEQFLMFFV